jgi:hypothetical protein
MLDEWLAEMGTRRMTGQLQNLQIDPALIGTEIADAMERNNTANQVYTDLLSEIAASKTGPQLPNSPAPAGNTTTNNQTTTYQVTLNPTIQVNGYNKDAKQIVRDIGPELMKWMDGQTRGSRI